MRKKEMIDVERFMPIEAIPLSCVVFFKKGPPTVMHYLMAWDDIGKVDSKKFFTERWARTFTPDDPPVAFAIRGLGTLSAPSQFGDILMRFNKEGGNTLDDLKPREQYNMRLRIGPMVVSGLLKNDSPGRYTTTDLGKRILEGELFSDKVPLKTKIEIAMTKEMWKVKRSYRQMRKEFV